jgi:hypothetical protein
MKLAAPQPLGERHRVADFDCGVASLNDWLKRRAVQNQTSGARRCFVAADVQTQVGIRGLIAHALSEEARNFYLKLGLDPSPLEPLTLMTTVADLRAALGN